MPQSIVILGMHRSGTSALAGLMVAAGASPGSPLVGANDGNPRGYWELAPLVAFNDRLLRTLGREWHDIAPLAPGWEREPAIVACDREAVALLQAQFAGRATVLLKDPRLCLTLPFWRRALHAAGHRMHVVVMVRPVAEVVLSLNARYAFPPSAVAYLWARSTLGALRATFDEPSTLVTFADVMARPARVAARIDAAAGTALTGLDAAAATVDPALYHQRDAATAGLPAALESLCADMYAACAEAAHLDARIGAAACMHFQAALGQLDVSLLPQLLQQALWSAREAASALADEIAAARVAHRARDERELQLRARIGALEAAAGDAAPAAALASGSSGTSEG
jgi:hypothetical protein